MPDTVKSDIEVKPENEFGVAPPIAEAVSTQSVQGVLKDSSDDGKKVVPKSKAKSTPSSESKKKKNKTPAKDTPKKEEGKENNSPLLRWLRSQTPQKKTPSADGEENDNKNASKQRKRKKPVKATAKDDASRIKTRVRYLLNRINREQTLIDAYSMDGWKGQSAEKVRPEQELKRAEIQILQCKLAIRKELEQLHDLSLQGSIQDTAFDDQGEIYFDDIFCAICKSKEVFPENDIILCDGACNRGFHQYCLDPPLKTEDIPPGDEGWLCPICDCKFECLDAINDIFGTNFEIEDSWEKVFAEAEGTGNAGENILGSQTDWPSEDSEDDDYNPIKPKSSDQDGYTKEGGSDDDDEDSSDDSDSDSDSSGSEVEFFDEFGGSSKAKKRHTSKDDGEDDDDDDDDDDTDEGDDETDELSDRRAEEDVVLVSGKRQRPEVDYKQLYDEVYGNASDYDSDEDEDYGKRKRVRATKGTVKEGENKQTKEKNTNVSKGSDNNIPESEPNQTKEGDESTPQGKKNQNRDKISPEILKKLQDVFKECELPSKARKQALSSELGVSFTDVESWFRNARRASIRKGKLSKRTDDSQTTLNPSKTMPGETPAGISTSGETREAPAGISASKDMATGISNSEGTTNNAEG